MDNKFTSPEDIRIALGLKPWDEYRLKVIRQILDEPGHPSDKLGAILSGRRTGKTTQMLTEALFAITQSYYVSITGHSSHQTKTLVMQARKYAEQLGLDSQKLIQVKKPANRPALEDADILFYQD